MNSLQEPGDCIRAPPMVCGGASSHIYEHLVHTSPQLFVTWEDTGVKNIKMVSLFDLHLDSTLVPRHCVPLGREKVALLVLDSDLKEEPD